MIIRSERFGGRTLVLLTGTLAATERGFEQTNQALKKRLEQQ